MRVLLTNDDGIQATGLNALRGALLEVAGVDLAVIAPNSNRSATGSRRTTASARSSSPWTVRWPGCRAQPANAVPSYSMSRRLVADAQTSSR